LSVAATAAGVFEQYYETLGSSGLIPCKKKGEKWLRDTVEWPGIRSYINKLKGRRRFVSIIRNHRRDGTMYSIS